MRFKEVQDLVVSLLRARTYTDLRALEAGLQRQGLSIGDDFVLTDERRQAIEAISEQIRGSSGATVIITGWYGSGKTTVLGELLRRFSTGSLKYDDRISIDPVEL